MITTITVDNLHCCGCANNIENTLKKLTGVQTVEVDQETREVVVEHDLTTTRDNFLPVLAQMGYPELGTSTILQKAKSYVSCAIGKLN
ncbi:MAG: heavy-metal-associated domain-containing protein [Saprospiraceae bacterium]